MKPNRRSLILGATLGVAVPSLVRAESLLDLPGDPLTARGMMAASKWAEEAYCPKPACRLVFQDGTSTGWMQYTNLSRPAVGDKTNSQPRRYAVALEVSTPNQGKRFITSVPIDAAHVRSIEDERLDKIRQSQARWELLKAR